MRRESETEVAIKKNAAKKKTLFFLFFFFSFLFYTEPHQGINLEFCSGNVAHFNKSERAGIKNFYEPPTPPLLPPCPST